MKRIKLFEQFIKEFVENSKITFEDLISLKKDIDLLIEIIEEDFDTEDDLLYQQLMAMKTFKEINGSVNIYFKSDNSLDINLERTEHLLKELIEQYDMKSVKYINDIVDLKIDKFVKDLKCLLPFAIKKMNGSYDGDIPCDFSTNLETEEELELVESLRLK